MGHAICEELEAHGEKFIVIDKNESRTETLRDEKFDASVGDITDEDLIEKISIPPTIFVVSSDISANISFTERVKKQYPNVTIFARVADESMKKELAKKGANYVILSQKIVSKVVYEKIKKLEDSADAQKLLRVLKETEEKLAIIVHDSPDPDALASALALKYIGNGVNVESDILYGKSIGHQENRSFVNLLNIELKKIEDTDLDEYDKYAFIDTVPDANNSVSVKPNIIIDHHEVTASVPYSDFALIDANYGSTAAIMTKFIRELNVDIPKEIASALLYGIRSDTQDFTRDTSSADLTAAAYLYPHVNYELLKQITSSVISVGTLNVLGDAIKNRKMKGSYLLSNVGFIRDSDTLSQAADYLLRLEGVTTAVVYGIIEDSGIYISARTKDIRVSMGEVLKEAFKDVGSAGGHNGMAAAQIPLGIFDSIKDKDSLIYLCEEAVTKRFLAAVGAEDEK
ncbi:MAG: putative manganese-dependent inorganic pyrophosphatase [Candidatus Methanolliviera sp. GoM_asphalt]|nr:MAG: putative manganese-dependent inorganic pyrophosphatase [Candidatus Methanolliviera sp. GoM_asphalt]